MKIGRSEGNDGAVIRWGKHLDNGMWFTQWWCKSLWIKLRIRYGYVRVGPLLLRWGN